MVAAMAVAKVAEVSGEETAQMAVQAALAAVVVEMVVEEADVVLETAKAETVTEVAVPGLVEKAEEVEATCFEVGWIHAEASCSSRLRTRDRQATFLHPLPYSSYSDSLL